MKLDALARAEGSLAEAAFLAKHPEPALVFFTTDPRASGEPPAESEQLLGPTHVYPVFDEATLLQTADAVEQPAPSGLADAQVIFLKKTDRNPFQNMITVGRTSNNDVCLPFPTISKVHAFFTKLPTGGWKLTDQRASNGTFVDGQRLPPGMSATLIDGGRVSFGHHQARFFGPKAFHGFLRLYAAGVAG